MLCFIPRIPSHRLPCLVILKSQPPLSLPEDRGQQHQLHLPHSFYKNHSRTCKPLKIHTQVTNHPGLPRTKEVLRAPGVLVCQCSRQEGPRPAANLSLWTEMSSKTCPLTTLLVSCGKPPLASESPLSLVRSPTPEPPPDLLSVSSQHPRTPGR